MFVSFWKRGEKRGGGGEAPVSLLSSRGFKGCLCAKERRRGRGGQKNGGGEGGRARLV